MALFPEDLFANGLFEVAPNLFIRPVVVGFVVGSRGTKGSESSDEGGAGTVMVGALIAVGHAVEGILALEIIKSGEGELLVGKVCGDDLGEQEVGPTGFAGHEPFLDIFELDAGAVAVVEAGSADTAEFQGDGGVLVEEVSRLAIAFIFSKAGECFGIPGIGASEEVLAFRRRQGPFLGLCHPASNISW
jgi:hypothetical protein